MKTKFWYQPDFAMAITCWSYTFMIFLAGFLLWLEITVFQVWSGIVFILFGIAVLLQLFLRWVEITPDSQFLILHTVLPQNTKKIKLNTIRNVSSSKTGISFRDDQRQYKIIMLKNKKQMLYNLISKD
ncbi:EbsA family protein [Liquorilactobacillus satsumensis]|uniref:EbsA family protein n=1 Tax=Liquorilactobacillus satsumensis TaxID=259059 RepID=UPI0039EADAC1